MAGKKKKATKTAMLDAEELVAGLRRARGHLPTKLSEAAHKARKKKQTRKAKNGPTFE